MRVAVCLGSSDAASLSCYEMGKKIQKRYLSVVDRDHLEAPDCGAEVCQRQAGLQHLCSHRGGGERDALLHSSSWIQWEHPTGMQIEHLQNVKVVPHLGFVYTQLIRLEFK